MRSPLSCALSRCARAAVFGEEAEQRIHLFVLRGVNHRTAVAPHGNETGHAQPVEMKRQRVRCEIKRRGDCTGLHAFRPRLNEQAENVETIILGESSQRRDGILFFHISTNMEML
jgi:hypothetical protein